jgi:hypothetical protein
MSKNSLETVKQKFEDWRSNKKRGEKIPKHLWCLVGKLMKKYPLSKIATQLGIRANQLRTQGLLPKQSTPLRSMKPSKQFVQLELPPLTGSSLVACPQKSISIERADGMKFIFTNPATEQITLLIQSFME